MSIGKKIKTLMAIIGILSICLLLKSISREYSSTDEEDYEAYVSEVNDAELNMPKLEELGDYESILISRRRRNDDFFDTTETVSLVVKYNDKNFDLAINNIEKTYEFISYELDNYKDFEANVDGYYFRVDSNSLREVYSYPPGVYELSPVCSLFVGVNTSKNTIAYLFFWDIEIHKMDDLDNFIEEKFVLE